MNKNKARRQARYTRKSYKRKVVMFGLSIFMAIALSATGFAAWVISNDTENAQTGQVTVGAISDRAIEMSAPTFVDGIKNFVFDSFLL